MSVRRSDAAFGEASCCVSDFGAHLTKPTAFLPMLSQTLARVE